MYFLKRISSFILKTLEKAFYQWGKIVTTYPFIVILGSSLLTGIACLGFFRFRFVFSCVFLKYRKCFSKEFRAHHLWIPEDSEYNINQNWIEKNFRKYERQNIIMFKSDNVLTPKALKKVSSVSTRNCISKSFLFSDVCSLHKSYENCSS